MSWQVAHHFAGLPCKSEPARCGHNTGLDIAVTVRDAVTRTLFRRGIDYGPVGDRSSSLWCLGGPTLYRLPMRSGYESEADAGTCLDLNVSICEDHQLFTAELFPYDLVPETGGSSLTDPLRSTPIALANDPTHAAAEFVERLEDWLDQILVLPNEP